MKNIANFAPNFVKMEIMKKFFFFITLVMSAFTGIAQTMPEDGFYRVKNNGTNHYIRVEDNTGSIEINAMTADMGAIQLWDGLEQNLDKPSSIIYCKKAGDGYDFMAQGTGVYDIIKHYVSLSGSYPIYQVYAAQNGLTLYLGDAGSTGYPFHSVGTSSNISTVNRRWYVEKVDANSDNYLGITPTLTSGGKHYAPFYVSFDISFASSGMKAYYISNVDKELGVAVIKQIDSERIPAYTPCLIECSSTDKSQNRVNVLVPGSNAITDNVLEGCFFCNEFRRSSEAAKTIFDENKMRVFNVEDGKLVLNTDKSTLHKSWYFENYPNNYPDTGERYLNANSSFLPVAEGVPASLSVVTEQEYEELKEAAGIEEITSQDGPLYYYSIDGKSQQYPKKGVNIVRNANGRTIKVLMK